MKNLYYLQKEPNFMARCDNYFTQYTLSSTLMLTLDAISTIIQYSL